MGNAFFRQTPEWGSTTLDGSYSSLALGLTLFAAPQLGKRM